MGVRGEDVRAGRYRAVICYRVASLGGCSMLGLGRYPRVPFRDILFRISVYKSRTPAEVHGRGRRAAPSSFKWNCVFIYHANRPPIAHRDRTLSAKTSSRIGSNCSLVTILIYVIIRTLSDEYLFAVELLIFRDNIHKLCTCHDVKS